MVGGIMRISVWGAVLMVAASSAWAQPGAKWVEVKTPHFTVMTNSSEKDARHVAVQFERMRAVFRVVMPSGSDDPASPIVVLALKDNKSFRTLEPEAYLAKNQLQLAGLFIRGQNRNYVLTRLDGEGDHPYATVYHEYTHYMLRRADVWMPLWMNEGLAEFYQNTQLQEKDVRVGQASVDDILYLRQNRLLPLQTILTVDHNSPYYHDEQKGSVFYAESWALMHYLQVQDFEGKTHRLVDYAKLMEQGTDSVTAAQKAFGDLDKLQKALDTYVAGGSFKEFKLIAPVAFTEATFEVRPVAEPEADAIRADVLVCTQRTKDAEALLTAVLAEDPKNAQAHETMGMLKFSQGQMPEARKWFTEAVALDSKSYMAHYYFAALSMQGGGRENDEAIEKSLRSSIELNPRFAPSYDLLANFYANHHEKLGEAYKLESTAVQLEPETISYRLNASRVLAEDQKIASALSVLKVAEPLAKTDNDKMMLKQRELEMQQYQDSLAHAQSYTRVETAEPEQPQAGTVVTTVEYAGGKKTLPVAAADSAPDPGYPAGPASGVQRTVSGVLRGVKCQYPTLLTLTLEKPGGAPNKPVALYTNNYFKIQFSAANYKATQDILPCSGIEGMKAKVVYAEVTDPRVAGQILSIELSR
jgi:tetratricopeptide (TPR) repeat protein